MSYSGLKTASRAAVPRATLDPMRWLILAISFLTSGFSFGDSPSKHKWGEFGFYSKWDRLSYEVDTEYPHTGALPGLDQFEELLTLAEADKVNDRTGREMLLSQLATLSRCEFDIYPADRSKSPHYEDTVLKYREWWNRYGKGLVSDLLKNGKRYPDAWRSLMMSPSLECPSYPLLLPESWSMKVKFRSGDYGGVVTEELIFKVSPEMCSLVRVFSTHTNAAAEREEWKDFGYAEAQSYLAALIYLIDNPWLVEEGESVFKVEGRPDHVVGRPKEWTLYYPSIEWTGVLDAEKKVILDDKGGHWHTVNHEAAPITSYQGLGIPFDLAIQRFPTKEYDPDKARWVALE